MILPRYDGRMNQGLPETRFKNRIYFKGVKMKKIITNVIVAALACLGLRRCPPMDLPKAQALLRHLRIIRNCMGQPLTMHGHL